MAPIVIPTRLGWWISLEVWVLTTVEIVGFDDGGSVEIGGWRDRWSCAGYGVVVAVA